MVEIRQGKSNKESTEKQGAICAMESCILERWMAGKSNEIPLEGGVVVFGGDCGKELDADTADTNPWVGHLASTTLLLVARHNEVKTGQLCNKSSSLWMEFVLDWWILTG